MRKLFLALMSLNLLFIRVHADQTEFDLKETQGQFLDITYQGKLVGRYLISRDSALENRHEIVKPFLDLYDVQGTDAITEGPPKPGIFIGYEKLRVNGKIYDLWHMKDGDQIHQNFSSMKATPDSASFTSLVD